MGARYYDPRSGRFISADPISYPLCYDLYTYANGDPINFRDPNGRFASPAYRFSGQTRMGFGSDVQTKGMTRIIAGLLEVTSGGIIANSGVGAPLGYFAIAHGSDQISTGIATLYSGTDRDSYTSSSLQSLGLPRGMANGIDSGLTALSYAQAACVVYGGLAGPTMGYSSYQTTAGGAGVYEAAVLRPLGLGSTGRTQPRNLNEYFAMKEIMSDPRKGEIIKRSLRDPRWKDWNKITWMDERTEIEIHYVGKYENGILKHVDDFKFIDPWNKK